MIPTTIWQTIIAPLLAVGIAFVVVGAISDYLKTRKNLSDLENIRNKEDK